MNNRKCDTCVHDEAMRWLSSEGLEACRVETRRNIKLGYPAVGDQCESYCRVPGSDDDWEDRE